MRSTSPVSTGSCMMISTSSFSELSLFLMAASRRGMISGLRGKNSRSVTACASEARTLAITASCSPSTA